MASRIRNSMATDFDNLADCLITIDADSRSVCNMRKVICNSLFSNFVMFFSELFIFSQLIVVVVVVLIVNVVNCQRDL